MFKRKYLSLSLIIVSLMTVSACVAVPPASLTAQPPDASRTSDPQPALSMKAASNLAGQPQSGISSPKSVLTPAPASVQQVAELPPLVPSSWKGDLRDLPPGKSKNRLKKQEGEPAAGAVT